MKKSIILFLFVLMLLPAVALAYSDPVDINVPNTAEEVILPRGITFFPKLVTESGEEISATWENPAQDNVWGDAEKGFTAVLTGESDLVATTEDGTTHEIKFVVPEVYFSVNEIPSGDKVVIEEKKAILIAYQTNINGITTIGTKGDSVSVTPLKKTDLRPFQNPMYHAMCDDMSVYRLMPVKAGDFKIIIKANGKTAKTITITVKKSALAEE